MPSHSSLLFTGTTPHAGRGMILVLQSINKHSPTLGYARRSSARRVILAKRKYLKEHWRGSISTLLFLTGER